MKKHVYLSLLSLGLLGAACQPGLVSPKPSATPSTTASPSARVLTITSETNDPNLPKILVPGLELNSYFDLKGSEFKSLGPMTQDEQGNLYISDFDDVRIRKIDSQGKVSTLAGTGKSLFKGKMGSFGETEFYGVGYLFFQSPNKILMSDRFFIYELNLETHQSKLLFATASSLETNFVEQTATLPIALPDNHTAFSIFNDSIFIAFKSEIWKITEIKGTYTLQRYAGNQFVDPTGGSIDDAARNFKDGLPDESKFNSPEYMVFDHQGNMYVSDYFNHRIRKVEVGTRTVSTLTGYGIPDPRTTIDQQFIGGFKDGDLNQALFNKPSQLVLTTEGDLLVHDTNKGGALRFISRGKVRTILENCACGILKDKNSNSLLITLSL